MKDYTINVIIGVSDENGFDLLEDELTMSAKTREAAINSFYQYVHNSECVVSLNEIDPNNCDEFAPTTIAIWYGVEQRLFVLDKDDSLTTKQTMLANDAALNKK